MVIGETQLHCMCRFESNAYCPLHKIVRKPRYDVLGVGGITERIRCRVEDRPVYIDVLTRRTRCGARPEAGGLSSRELLATLRSFARLNLVGTDIVEVAPANDHAEITVITAAHVGYELLSAQAADKSVP